MTEIEQHPQNGIDLTTEDDESSKSRPADIEQDMREMERRKRVEAIMGSKLFREELERIVDSAREGGASGILQQLSDIVGLPASRVGNVFKASNCMVPINDIRGVESIGYAKGEKILRCKLAATFRLLDLYGWTQGLGPQITARLKVDQEIFLVNPYGMLYHEITASSLNKVDMQGQVVEQGTTNFGVNKNHFTLHSIVHAARPDIRCAIYIGCSAVVAVSSLKTGLLPITKDACVLGEITTHSFSGSLVENEERDKLVRNLGPNSKVILLTNHGALCCGESIEEAFFAACHIVQACETQLKLLPIGVENLVLIPEESRKLIYEQARRPPEDLEKKFAAALANTEKTQTATGEEDGKMEDVAGKTAASPQKAPNWRVGGAEFEALMRMLDNAGFRTGYIYRHPLVKSELPKPKNDVELPPAVSSLGYLLEEEELYRQGIWKKGDSRKGGDRCRWLNSPNVYQKVEVLETGTPDPKKITKWIAEGSPTHGTPVRIEDALQFVPAGTSTKEFKRVQQQIKDNRRADKISAGPQSQILEGVTWDEANRIKDATVSSAGDHVVLMGAASKGIIQRGFQHNATVYKTPYAKNPFDNVTDDELNEYKRTVERKKKSIHGEYTDTDFSETEALSSVHASAGPTLMKHSVAAVSQSEPEDVSEHQVMRIETQQAPVPSQPEVILSDDIFQVHQIELSQKSQDHMLVDAAENKENVYTGNQNINCNKELIADLKKDLLFQRQKEKLVSPSKSNDGSFSQKFTKTENKTLALTFSTNEVSEKNKSICDENKTISSHPNNIHVINGSLTHRSTQLNSNEYFMQPNWAPTSFTSAPTKNYCKDKMIPANSEPLKNDSGRHDLKSPCETGASQRLYSKSLFCYTPNVCDSVFEALQRPLDNDLILNIPFTIPFKTSTSLDSAPNEYPLPTDLGPPSPTTPNSPYRTLSHFGFNSPQSVPKPEHKHIPRELFTKYIPLVKSTSYEEIFSSPRYVDLCENCFEKIVRLKPELVYMKTRLRNLVDFHSSNKIDGSDFVGCGSSETTETLPVFPAPLEPVIEEASELVSSDEDSVVQFKSLEKSISNSTFIEKISRMNYSEESANANFSNTPRTASSNISLVDEIAEHEDGDKDENKEYLCTTLQQITRNPENRDLSECDSVTEIWEFGNWQGQTLTCAENERDDGDCTFIAKLYNSTSKDSHRSKKRRFMSREERNKRKHEFQELWEDHITFFNNKDETLSDTESAIDETVGNALGVQDQMTDGTHEIFHGRSMVIKRLFSEQTENPHHLHDGKDGSDQIKALSVKSSVDGSILNYSLNVDEGIEFNTDFSERNDANNMMTISLSEEKLNYCSSSRSERFDCDIAENAFIKPNKDEININQLVRLSHAYDCYDRRSLIDNEILNKSLCKPFLEPAEQGDTDNVTKDKKQNSNVCLKTSSLNFVANSTENNKKNFPTLLSDFASNQEIDFNSLERIILEKIKANQLNKSEEIFDKIESTIRNKLTPSKIEELLHKQKELVKDSITRNINFELTVKKSKISAEECHSVNPSDKIEASAPLTRSSKFDCQNSPESNQGNMRSIKSIETKNYFADLGPVLHDDMVNFRRSRSVILCCHKPLENISSQSTLDQLGSILPEPQSTRSISEVRSKIRNCKRNFVLENIRNAATPRNVKRLQRPSASSVFMKNSGCATIASSTNESSQSFQLLTKSDVSETDVFTFQTKLVRGSPRFWVSMSQTPTKKLQNSKHFQISNKNKRQKLHPSNSSISTGTLEDVERPLVSSLITRTSVDLELAALSLELEDAKPQLKCYESKLNDFGDHVAECTRNIDKCVEEQLGIEKEHNKLRDDILLNQYVEDISCKAQTFSLSETED